MSGATEGFYNKFTCSITGIKFYMYGQGGLAINIQLQQTFAKVRGGEGGIISSEYSSKNY